MLGVQERESYDLGFCCVASTFCVAFNKLSNHAEPQCASSAKWG